MQRVAASVRMFAPEQWGELEFFIKFYNGTHIFRKDAEKAVLGLKNHFHKAIVLYRLAGKLLPNLEIDERELFETGATSAINEGEFTAVLEEVFTEIYSVVECCRKVLSDIYRGVPRLPTDSTRKFFLRVRSGEVGPGFPAALQGVIAECDWYDELRQIRDELTHADVGRSTWNSSTGKVSYSHSGIRKNGQSFVMDDVMARASHLIDEVNRFLGLVFNFLNSQLAPTEVDVLCGVFDGRGYMRRIPLQRPVTFDSGSCLSAEWFEREEGFRCPFADSCGAFRNAQ